MSESRHNEHRRNCLAAGTLLLAALFSLPGSLGAQTLGGQANCTGTLPNGWTFAAEALDGRFLHIIWTGNEGQTRVSLLSYYSTNADGFPVFQGTLQDALNIALVDKSGGTPATGTEVEVFSEDWGWFPGVCRQLGSNVPEGFFSTEAIRQNLVGTRDSTASNWLRRNGFTRLQIVTHSIDGKTERWQQDPSYPVDVVFSGTMVSDVISAVH
jgi:hypothetical protein